MTNSATKLMIYVCCDENYSLHYSRNDPASAMRTLGRWANDPELAFSWHDAAVMSLRVRALALSDGIGIFSHGGSNLVSAQPQSGHGNLYW